MTKTIGFVLGTVALMLLPVLGLAQPEVNTVLGFRDFLEQVKVNHPMARQANLRPELGAAQVMGARGAFDPKTEFQLDQKYFKSTDYYRLIDGNVKVPTAFGVEFKGGYEQNEGVFLNPEDNTPGGGLWYAGLSVPLGQGLLMDKRRTELRKAQQFLRNTEAEQNQMLNELITEAGQAYWQWFKAYHVREVYVEALGLATQRYNAVVQSAILGDRPAIDTVEASIQVTNRTLGLQQADLDFRNAGALLSTYLWDRGTTPLELGQDVIPLATSDRPADPIDASWYVSRDSLIERHPEMVQSQVKVEQALIDRRWMREQLKPQLNLKYNAITEPVGSDVLANYSSSNYTYGVQFSLPVPMRKARSGVQKAQVKLRTTEWDMSQKRAMLNFKVRSALNDWQTTGQLVTEYTRNVDAYDRLLDGERLKFQAGESSLFLVNRRELGYIDARTKLIGVLAKNEEARLKVDLALGFPNGR